MCWAGFCPQQLMGFFEASPSLFHDTEPWPLTTLKVKCSETPSNNRNEKGLLLHIPFLLLPLLAMLCSILMSLPHLLLQLCTHKSYHHVSGRNQWTESQWLFISCPAQPLVWVSAPLTPRIPGWKDVGPSGQCSFLKKDMARAGQQDPLLDQAYGAQTRSPAGLSSLEGGSEELSPVGSSGGGAANSGPRATTCGDCFALRVVQTWHCGTKCSGRVCSRGWNHITPLWENLQTAGGRALPEWCSRVLGQGRAAFINGWTESPRCWFCKDVLVKNPQH